MTCMYTMDAIARCVDETRARQTREGFFERETDARRSHSSRVNTWSRQGTPFPRAAPRLGRRPGRARVLEPLPVDERRHLQTLRRIMHFWTLRVRWTLQILDHH